MVSGLLLIDKESGMTSHDVVNRVRKIYGTKKVGHTGTLDPNATGLLVILMGEATKLIPYLEDSDKRYTAEVVFGAEMDTDDETGQITLKSEVGHISKESLEEALGKFVGEIDQVPPIYSAKKKDGKKLYEYARKGQQVELEPSRVKIDSLTLLNCDELPNRASIDVECSKGTYIRALARDIGRELKSAAHMGSLVRTESGLYSLGDAHTLEELELSADPAGFVTPLESIALPLPKVEVRQGSLSVLGNGGPLPEERLSTELKGFGEGEFVQLYSNGSLLGIGVVKRRGNSLYVQPKRVFPRPGA